MEEIGFAHGLVKYLHILLFVYWLGGDAGVFYSSKFVTNTQLSREARLTAFKIFINLDMLPRYCLALMLTVGGVLSEFVGYEHPLWQMIFIVLLGPAWVWVVHTIHAREGTEFGRTLAIWDRLGGLPLGHRTAAALPVARGQATDLCLPDLLRLHDSQESAAVHRGVPRACDHRTDTGK
jgi:hypothetical protein